MNEALDRFISLLFPKGCVLCAGIVAYDDLTCKKCLPDRPAGELCKFCGKPAGSCVCDPNRPWRFERAVSALNYQAQTRDAILRLKTELCPRTARFFANEMAQAVDHAWPDVTFDLVTEIPMHPEKLARRSFNQAALLAAQVARVLHIPHRTGLLECCGALVIQHTLGRDERFSAAEMRYRLAAPHAEGKVVLIIDDVMTTGATFDVCAGRLLDGGAKAVYALAAAGTNKDIAD